MQQPTFDPGLTQQYAAPLRRAINQDGSFNVIRRGRSWRDFHPYLHLVNMRWWAFACTIVSAYLVVNTAFAAVYYALGPEHLTRTEAADPMHPFLTAFFFSADTLTTVGYGHIAPRTVSANFVSIVESMVGLLGFAVATGLLFGRVSRPSARMGFSERALIAPYQDGMSLQFRVVNRRSNALMELEARVMLMTVVPADSGLKRKYELLALERDKIYFFPLTWTVVHPIDAASPLYGKSPADLEQAQAELLILIKAWDETFSQTVHQRFSYRYDEIDWRSRFTPAFAINENGDMELYVDRVGLHSPV